jgi:hypothetical protein
VAVLALVGAVLALPVGGASATPAGGEGSYTITVTNVTDAQYLTPPNWAAHSRQADVFQVGRPASPGVQAVAENGGVPVLAGELAAAVDGAGLGVSGVAGPAVPIGPGQSRTFEVTTGERWLSVVAMLVCTNDGFAGLDTKALPSHPGQTRTYNIQAFDAGTEVNTELRQDLVPAPFCGEGEGSGQSNPALAEGGVVRPHQTLKGVGDLDPALDWAGPVATITITRN